MVLCKRQLCKPALLLRLYDKHYSGKETSGAAPEPKQLTKNTSNGLGYCMNLVKNNDYENYLCTLLLKNHQRRQGFVVRALNVELAKCGTVASEDQLMRMRLRFWQDSIDNCLADNKGYVEDQPVLKELKSLIVGNPLIKTYLKRLIGARERPLAQPFISSRQLEDYAEQSNSAVLHLLVQLSGVKDMNVDHAASHLGKAQGIANMLRSIPYTGRKHAICIPQEVLVKHGVSTERVIRNKDDDVGVRDCVFEVASIANTHLEKAREMQASIPKEVRKLFLPAVPVGRYLERLRLADFRLTAPSCMQRDLLLPLALYMHSLRRSY